MSRDVDLLVGTAGLDGAPSLKLFAREIAGVLGLENLRVGDPECVIGDGEDFRAWLRFAPEDEEPSLSHPFRLEVAAEMGAEYEVGRRVFQKLADTRALPCGAAAGP
ncbi:hypothetical protein [Micromonospora sp. IBHARD004]|uniref:hypothetical protein n=1 Tax=Micromonospora sp. IBHARD004 TaxID=3457764 RepID=UPI0040597593